MFKRKTVDQIVAGINKHVADLRAAWDHHTQTSQAFHELATHHADEADRAERIAGKFKDLIS